MAYWDLEPFGPLQMAQMAGVLASLIANAHRDPEKRSSPFEPADFFPQLEPEPEEEPGQSWQAQLAYVEMLNELFGGQDLRGQHGDNRDPGSSPDPGSGSLS